MTKNSFLSFVLLSSTFLCPYAASADVVDVHDWYNLKGYAQTYDNTYKLQPGYWPGFWMNNDQSFDVGSKDSEQKGSWNIDGNKDAGVVLQSNYKNNALAIMNNITSFVFENIKAEEFKKDGGWGGFIYNESTAETAELKNSEFLRSGAKLGGIIYNNGGHFSLIDNNKFQNGFVDYGSGSVIYNDGTIDVISNNEFSNNVVNQTDTDYRAGAIFNKAGATITTIKDNKFIQNKASGLNGAAINNAGTITEIIGGEFTDNGYTKNDDGSDGGYYSSVGGAIYNAYGATIGQISSVFSGNKSQYKGGAIFNDGKVTTIGSEDSLSGSFVNNYAENEGGGAIFNNFNGEIGTIFSNFEGNNSNYSGGAIYNQGQITKISGTFSDNYSGSYGGGAIKNEKTIGSIVNATFENNYSNGDLGKGGALTNGIDGRDNPADNTGISINEISNSALYNNHSNDFGGALNNFATINKIDNVTFGAEGKGNQGASGGALNNQWSGKIGSISNSTFAYNQALETTDLIQGNGGAIRNFSEASIGLIENSTFDHNTAGGLKQEFQGDETKVFGGAIFNAAASIKGLKSITFTNNMAAVEVNDAGKFALAQGGAVYNGEWDGINAEITEGIADSTFENNSAQGTTAFGGAIFNNGTMGAIVNTSFKNNFASARDNALGGAIYSTTGLDIQAQDGESIFEENYAQTGDEKVSNSIYMAGTDDNLLNLNLTSTGEKGLIRFDDGIDGKSYNIALDGDAKGVIRFNSTIKNAGLMTLTQNTHMQMGLGADINVENMSIAPSIAKQTAPVITVDVEVDRANNTVNSGKINVAGDLEGHYDVIVNSLNPDVLDNLDDAIVPFLYALKDNAATASSFNVARVVGSPYLWDGKVNAKGEEEGSTWYLGLTDQENPDFEKPVDPVDPVKPLDPTDRPVYAEVVGALGLHEAAIEQTRSVVRHVSQQTALSKEYCRNCGVYGYDYNGKELKNVWVDVIGEYANIDKPVDMDADIWGVEAGFDLQRDVHNTLGVFASYRKGNYDLSGKADRLSSKVGSEIDIDSYLAGLYYRYDKNMNWAFATVYGGIQKADVKADDGFAKFDTDGIEFGAAVEIGRTIPLAQSWTLNPSIGLSYTQINYDNAHDNVGKSYKWDDVKFVEAEIGARLDKQFDQGKIYVKPSLIQTFTDGDEVQISGMNHKYDTYKDQTLGRIEVGGRYGFNDNWSGYAWANYTFGSSYDATAGGLGISYSW